MKSFFITLSLIFVAVIYSQAQTTHDLHGVIIDTTKLSVVGAQVKLISDQDSVITTADNDGKFSFSGIKSTKITITFSSMGYITLRKHYALDASPTIDLGTIVMRSDVNNLAAVTIVGQVNPVRIAEDTIEYKVSAYPVRQNAPIEDVLKKIPGVDVDVNGNVTAQGKQVTKVRVNGKDFFGGDVQTATKNLPADMIESIQMIDDYGDQANLTGVKTGEPDKIMNITIRKDKNYGYSAQGTAGDGADLLPASQGSDQNRYIGTVNAFDFNGDRQISLLGSDNNTNVNPFNYNTAGSTVGGSGFSGGGGGGGGGRGNALRAQQSTGLTTTANGITDARSIGTNYRDQWGKYISVYGSYSFTDNSTLTNSTSLQTNNNQTQSASSQTGTEKDNPINHRFTFNMEYKPDTINYLKVTPTFSYASTNTTDFESVTSSRNNAENLAYTSSSISNSSAPTFGVIALYNHRFNGHGRNFSANFTVSTAKTSAFDNPIYDYTLGTPTAPANQLINTDGRTTSFGTTLSYLEPLSKLSYLEFNYAYNHSYTTSDKETDTLAIGSEYNNDPLLSNNYNFTFTTNRFGLNYRFVQQKYNYTLGIAAQPATLDGESITNNNTTHASTFEIIPTAHFVYNFSRSQSFSVNYSGSSAQPTFSQLQPVIDYSNALYPVEGNAKLDPSFNNSFQIRYNKFSFATGNIFFIGAFFTQTNNYVATNTITYPDHFSEAALTEDPGLKHLANTNLTTYLNTNGYYTGTAFFAFAKPWENRKYTLSFNGNATYTNNIAYSGSVDTNNVASAVERNIAKSLTLTPSVRFRVDIIDVIDAQALTSYAITRTTNSIVNPLFDDDQNIRTLTYELTGKNYFWKDWTLSYDYTKQLNYGYAKSINVTNPNLLNLYVERRFLKNNAATIRLAAYDLFNQNTGFTTSINGNTVTQSNVNRLGRYYLATITIRLQKFAGKAPEQPQGQRGFRRDGPGGGGPGGPGGGPGGPGGGGGPGGFSE